MDQIRRVLAWLKDYHFWVLSVLVGVIALVCWKMAAGTLIREYNTNKTTITGEFNNEKQFRSKQFHPNQKVIDEQVKQIEEQAKHVEAIWRSLYERQTKGVLTWPSDLSQGFRDFVTKSKFGEEIPPRLRDNYRDYIDRHFEALPKIIGARILADETAMGGGEGFGRGGFRGSFRGDDGPGLRMRDEMGTTGVAAGQDDDYICEWLDQGLVRQELDFRTTPSSWKIWVTQENLWVYETLLDVVAKTNNAKGADRMSNAAVKVIYSLEVGRPAALASMASGRVEILQAAAASTGEGGLGMEGGEGGREAVPMTEFSRSPMGEGGFDARGGGMTPEQEQGDLLAGRYVDDKGTPIGLGGGAVAGMEGGDAAAAAPSVGLPDGPYKRLPVRMVLKMDQRWLTRLIAECANQPLPVEVKEVRINPPDAGGGEMGGRGEGSRFGYGDSSGAASGSAYQKPYNPGDVLTFPQRPEIATVAIQGIVTIYKEPDATLLKPESTAADQVAGGP